MSPSDIKKSGLLESEFMQNRLTLDSPRVLRFGTRHCGNMAQIQIEFVSMLDGKRHELGRRVAAPVDKNQHTYRLNWASKEDSYTIVQDGELLVEGTISEDFDGFYEKIDSPQQAAILSAEELNLIKELEVIPEFLELA